MQRGLKLNLRKPRRLPCTPCLNAKRIEMGEASGEGPDAPRTSQCKED